MNRFHNSVISLLQPAYTGDQDVSRPDPGSGCFVVWTPFQSVRLDDTFRSCVFDGRPECAELRADGVYIDLM